MRIHLVLCASLLVAACGDSSTTGDAGTDSGRADSGSDSGSDAGSDSGADSGPTCAGDPTVDDDHDGFTEADGDCDDCNAAFNPGAVDLVDLDPGGVPLPDAMQVNPTCDGMPPVLPGTIPTCDATLALDDVDPIHAAQALGLCARTTATARTPGLIDAHYVRADGRPFPPGTQAGIKPGFGPSVSPVEGANLLVLSSGRARTPFDADACVDANCTGTGAGTAPPGFPLSVALCPTPTSIYDDVALELSLRVPTNANGLRFSFSFYAHDFPSSVCTSFSDQFIALVSPPPPGSISGNVALDAFANPVNLSSYFPICDESLVTSYASMCTGGTCPSPPSPYCPAGTSQLLGTGFDTGASPAGGATGWLQSTAPLTPGSEVTLRFIIYDVEDGRGDSTVLLDGVRWIAM